MNTIILTENVQIGKRIQVTLSALSQQSIEIFRKKDILTAPDIFEEVEYIFSSWGMTRFSKEDIKKCLPKLKAIFYAAGSVKHFGKEFIESGIQIYTATKINGIPVAEFVAAQIILANKGYYQATRTYRNLWHKRQYSQCYNHASHRPGNYKSKIGVVGCGNIGRMVLDKLSHYDLELYYYDPNVEEDAVKCYGAKRLSMEEIFRQCDVITTHLPNIPELNDVINYSLLSLMKDNATFINTGRGAQINEDDLVKVMKEKPNACALLDVTKQDPLNYPRITKLMRQKNIFVSPHIAGSLGDEFNRMVEYVYGIYDKIVNDKTNELKEIPISLSQIMQQT